MLGVAYVSVFFVFFARCIRFLSLVKSLTNKFNKAYVCFERNKHSLRSGEEFEEYLVVAGYHLPIYKIELPIYLLK